MHSEASIFQSCSQISDEDSNKVYGSTIIFIHPKTLDLLPFSILQAIGSLSGLKIGDYSQEPCNNVLLIDGAKSAAQLKRELKLCDYKPDLEKMNLLSMVTYNSTKKSSTSDPDIPVTHSSIVDKIEQHAKDSSRLCVIYHDIQSLTGGGSLCKPADFKDLHNRLNKQGSLQLYFVNSEAEALQIAVKPELIFNVEETNGTNLPTIRLTLNSAPTRLQNTILPVEIEFHENPDGVWKGEESVNREDQEETIKLLALMGKTRKQIAETLGNISESTVCRRLTAMQDRGEIKLMGHRVIRA